MGKQLSLLGPGSRMMEAAFLACSGFVDIDRFKVSGLLVQWENLLMCLSICIPSNNFGWTSLCCLSVLRRMDMLLHGMMKTGQIPRA